MNENAISTKQKITNFFKDGLLVIILIVSLVAFAFKEVINFGTNEDFNWYKIIVSGIITYLFAVYIFLVLGELGIKKGKSSQQYQSTMQDLSKAKSEIAPFVDKLPLYVAYKNQQAIKEVRINILSECAMTYEKFKNGYYKEHYEELSDIEKQAYNMATTIRIETISARDLLSENSIKEKFSLSKKKRYAIKYNPLKMGRTEQQFVAGKMAKKLISKLVYPFIFSYLVIQSIVWGNLLYGALQSILILLGGSINYITSEDFVVNELRNRFISKADFLKEFKVMYDSKSPIFEEEADAPVVQVVEVKKEENNERVVDLRNVIPMNQLIRENEEISFGL